MRILVADDEQILLTHLCRLVSEILPDAEISAFSNGKSILESAKENKYDIAFLDIQMPEMNGIELAKELKNTNNKMNIIFVTGYDGYQGDAMDLFASGYIKKPATSQKIQEQLENLRYPVASAKKRIYAQTFGVFTLFIDEKPILFSRAKSQEVFAYLIHRRGSVVSKKEISCAVFDDGIYDSNRMSYMSKLCTDMQNTLKSHGADNLILTSSKGLAVNISQLDCDLYSYLKNNGNSRTDYNGEYMSQYSWADEFQPVIT